MDEATVRHGLAVAAAPVMRCESAGRTHPGKVRRINEDACVDRAEIGLWAVADGVGGEHAGDRASGLVVDSLGRVPAPSSGTGFLGDVGNSLRAVNQLLRIEAQASGSGRLMASTIVSLLFFGGYFACAWAGDSRLYLFRHGRLQQVTRDHSEVQEMVDAGLLTPDEARVHPRGNVITRAVGAQDQLVLEMVQDQVRQDDVFLLCTDGLTKMLEDSEIAALLVGRTVQESVDALIEATLERGAKDNVTVMAVRAVSVQEAA